MGLENSQSEKLELAAMHAIHESASEETRSALGLRLEQLDGFVCSASSVEPSILVNRCFVTDASSLNDVAVVQAVKAFYADAGVARFFLHVVDSNEQSRSTLEQAGMQKARSWMKFTRDTSPAVARNQGLEIRKIGPEHAEDFARVVAPCFDMTDASIPFLAGMVNHPNWHLYMGFDEDRPAATGGMFVQGDAALCDWGSTHSDFRRRGFQGAVLSRRINDASEMGVARIFTETGEAVEGDPQHSYSNIMRYGFIEDYLRENWVPK